MSDARHTTRAFTDYASVDERDADWIARAVHFSAFILVGGMRFHEDCPTMLAAAKVAADYERVCADQGLPNKRAMVYAITAEQHSTMVPRAQWLAALSASA